MKTNLFKIFFRLTFLFLIISFSSELFAGNASYSAGSKNNNEENIKKISEDPIMKALSKELARHFDFMQTAEKVPLYYLGYEASDEKSYYIFSEMGAIKTESSYHSRQIDIDARFGSHELDNTHQIKGSYDNGITDYSQPLPIDDDEDALRAAIWRHTDAALKRSHEAYTKVLMNKALTAEEEDGSPDFSSQPAHISYDSAEMPAIDKEKSKKLLNAVSAAMKKYDFVYSGGADLSASASNKYIVNSEGSKIRTGRSFLRLTFYLASRTEDGMELYRSRDYNVNSEDELPGEKELLAELSEAAKELLALRNAPAIEPYSGPAIMNARAAGVFFHEIIGHRLEGHRQKLEDSGQTFAKKLGEKVTADFLTLYDDPNIKEWNGIPLRGHYSFDDEGVPAEKALLIENGVLKGFLMGRSPIRGFSKSNGHGRKSSGYQISVSRMGNTIAKADISVSYAELRKMLIEEIKKQGKPFGLVFDDISGGYTMTGRGSGQTFKVNPLMVYKVYADGRPDELVRGADLVGTPIASFAKISAAADDYSVFNGDCGAESGWVPVSAVAPSILISEIEVEKSQKSQARQPVLPPPSEISEHVNSVQNPVAEDSK
ncbi:MAG: TldD/PmbA family protein [Elusimicrobiales bacterium]|nr:TldD/PmbA family protein [Elusimicrobiales bacterium]